MRPQTREQIRRLVINRRFEYVAMFVILLNSVVIGVETYYTNHMVHSLNYVCLFFFTIELGMRYFACYTNKEFFSNRWNIFDLVIVVAGYIPPSIVGDNGIMVEILRLIRVFRVLRLLRTLEELRLIVTVLMRSMRTLTYNLLVMFIFLYVFAITGIYLFRLPPADQLTPEQVQAVEELREMAPWPTPLQEEPYANLSEAMFTLVRCMSGDAWSDIRYSLCAASRLGLIEASELLVTTFHIIWYILAAFLLINIIIGAVLNNFESAMRQKQQQQEEEAEQERQLRHEHQARIARAAQIAAISAEAESVTEVESTQKKDDTNPRNP